MTADQREQSLQPVKFPASLAPLVQGRRWARSTVGESGDAIYRLQADTVPDLYLKHAPASSAQDVAGEMVRLQWLARNITVPAIRCFIATPDEAWLLMTALPGQTAWQALEACADRPNDRVAIVDALARFLRQLHAIPVESCPFNSDHHLRLGEARWRLDAGLVDVEGFDEDRKGWTAEQVWDEMTALLPFAPDPVVTHGDVSLDNIIMADGDIVGCIDPGRAGIADRYQDLAILWNCLGEFGPALQQRLFESYGIDQPDERKIRFHLMLDELF
ncbi:MAG: APH(3')-I family aminoglycoside O-phosphotransferase [Sphingomonas sp.]